MKGFISTPSNKTNFREIINSRNLIYELIRRDFIVRYKQTGLGIIWAIINPGINIILYIFVFGLLVKIPTPEYNAPYAYVLISGILFWGLFSNSMMVSSDALINNMHLITKVYFPRLSLCIASVFVALIDFFIAFIVFIPLSVICLTEFIFLRFFFLIPCILITFMLGCGVGCVMAVLKLKYRDIRHMLPLFNQILFFSSPVVYTLSIVPDNYKIYYLVNPLTGIIELSRWAILGAGGVNIQALVCGLISAVVIMLAGIYYFISNDGVIADYE
ncbi:ABC transporter permease [Xenorhabdus sp. KJ12.1]|uniref:ABC transporter permease n=1 Tax=Xenorhabdus sp. KJ12.1 TaxID=1851571 RepID=UPI000C04FC64|nr:ABC transporter permease [Xenorhabdus sp. KJ12.1]PHM66416.1 ABC transporter [Xenorhabdus sp. KJ12.1]